MMPQHIEEEKCIQFAESFEDKVEREDLEDEEGSVRNDMIDVFDENLNNQQNSQDNESLKAIWTYQQEIHLYKLHDELGNKWSMIAEHFKNKTDNSIKNHFYSRLRKALRRLNKIISVEMKKSMKEIKNNVIYKIIQVVEERHKVSSYNAGNEETFEHCRELKSRLFHFSYDDHQTTQTIHYDQDDVNTVGKKLIEDLVTFNRQYRRKAKKTSNSNEQCESKSNNNKKLKKTKSQNTEPYALNASDCSVFECQNLLQENKVNNTRQVLTRRRVKSSQYQQTTFKPQIQRNSTLTLPSANGLLFKEQYETFFRESGILQRNIDCFPVMRKNQSIEMRMIEDDAPEMLFFDEIEAHNEKIDSMDHFNDLFLNEGDFSLFK